MSDEDKLKNFTRTGVPNVVNRYRNSIIGLTMEYAPNVTKGSNRKNWNANSRKDRNSETVLTDQIR